MCVCEWCFWCVCVSGVFGVCVFVLFLVCVCVKGGIFVLFSRALDDRTKRPTQTSVLMPLVMYSADVGFHLSETYRVWD